MIRFPENWRQVEEVFQQALDQPEQERARYVEDLCADDDLLKRETISLLDAYEAATDFFEQPAIARDAQVLIDDGFDLQAGRTIGPYTIVRRLGGGGMGEVYLADDQRLGRAVALKILPEYFAADTARLNRFQREARAASALNHPNILTIHEVGEHDQVHYIATEFIDGLTLRELIKSEELTLTETLEIVEQVASALDAAHRAGIVHRDVKPENIMRRADGLVKILDFGIAKLVEPAGRSVTNSSSSPVQTEIGVVMGTVEYMSPEQARGLVVDQRTDIWSLGVVLYEVVTGRLPFSGPTRMDAMVAILEREPLAVESVTATPDAAGVQRVITKALRKKPEHRYQTAGELSAELSNVRQRLAESPPSATTNHVIQTSRRKTGWVALALVLVFAVAIGFVVYRASNLRRQTPSVATVPPAIAYANMSDEQRLAFVREQEQRISELMGDDPQQLPPDAVQAIKRYVDFYAARTGSKSSEAGKDSLEVIYSRAQSYVPLIKREFSERKVPVMIGIYLPMLESEYRLCTESPFGAKGMFQFLPQTARIYGVAPDEMCDVEKMAPAAADYIADHMAELGEDAESMTLVLVSYNRGSQWVRSTLRELRGTENYQRNFWTFFAHRDKLDDSFRNETAAYVPGFFAVAIIGENPQRFGLSIPPLSSLANSQRP